MAKKGERQYFKKIDHVDVEYSLHKPFSDGVNIGSLLHDIATVFSLLPSPGQSQKILDLGCGTGWTSSFYARSGHHVTGVDISPDAIELAKKHFASFPTLSFACYDYDVLPYKNQFDVAVFFDSLHHAEDELASLVAAYKALKPGGKIIVCEPGRGHAKSPASIQAVKKYGVNERDMPPKLSKKQLKRAGFTGIKTYAYPALVHRALYKDSSSKLTALLRGSTAARGLTVAALASIAKPWHGIVTAIK